MAEQPFDVSRARHALLGISFLLAWVLVDLRYLVAATAGREAFAVRYGTFSGFATALWVSTFLVPALAHAALGFRLARVDRGSGPFGDESARKLQWGSAAVLFVFILAHLRHTPLAIVWGDVDVWGLYARLRTELPTPPWVAVYVVGLTALALHLQQGLSAAVDVLVRRSRARRWLRFVSLFAAAGIYLVAMNALSHFVVGRAIFGADP